MLLTAGSQLVPASLHRIRSSSSSRCRQPLVLSCLLQGLSSAAPARLPTPPACHLALQAHGLRSGRQHSGAAASVLCWAGRSAHGNRFSSSSSSDGGSSGSSSRYQQQKPGGNKQQGANSSSSSSSSRPGGKQGSQQQGSREQSDPPQQNRGSSPRSSSNSKGHQSPKPPASQAGKSSSSSRTATAAGKPASGRSSSGPGSSSLYKPSSSSSSSSSSAPTSSPLPGSSQLLVVGGGAAGLTAAYFAAKAGAQVCVLERTREAGKKILMSGGARCNVLPAEVELHTDYVTSSSSSALRAVFASWTLQQCHDWLSHDVRLQLLLEKETNKWFPSSNSSREVRDRLVAACEKLGVSFVYNASVEHITPPGRTAAAPAAAAAAASQQEQRQQQQQQPSGSSSSSHWQVVLAGGARVSAQRVIMSTGGRSFPAVGTDGTGLALLAGLGHKLVPQYAALTPLKGPHPGGSSWQQGGQQLAGLTLSDVRLSAVRSGGGSKVLAVAQRGGLLFTHKGYSGPAILDLSHWLVRELEQQQQQQQQQQAQAAMPRLVVDWCGEGPEVWQQRLAAAPGGTTVESLLKKGGVKDRLAAALALEVGVSGRPISQLRKGEREALLAALTSWPLPVSGHEGYKKAEVTGGGVVLEQVDCKTMESRLLPGLHLCGEVLDVFGRIGGFNFYWAWLTGRMAGLGAAAALAAAATTQPAGAVAGAATC